MYERNWLEFTDVVVEGKTCNCGKEAKHLHIVSECMLHSSPVYTCDECYINILRANAESGCQEAKELLSKMEQSR